MTASPRGHSRLRRVILIIALYLALGVIINIAIAWALATDPGPYVLVDDFVHTAEPIFWAPDFEHDLVWGGVAHERSGRYAMEVYLRYPLAEFIDYWEWTADGPDSTFEMMYREGMPRLPEWSAVRTFDELVVKRPKPPTLRVSHLSDRAFGWPMLALTCHWRTFGPMLSNANRYQREVISGLGINVQAEYDEPTGFTTGSYYTVQHGTTFVPFFYLPPRDPIVLPLRPIWTGFLLNTLLYAFLAWIMTIGPFQIRRAVRTKRGRCPRCGYNVRGAFDDGCSECGWNRGGEGTEASRQQGIKEGDDTA